MGIPIYTHPGGGGTGPAQIPIEPLDTSLYARSARNAAATPSTAGAIADAITSGIETYQNVRAKNQQIMEADQVIAQNQIKLQQQQAAMELQPMQIDLEKQKLETDALEQKVKYQDDQRALSLRSEELNRKSRVNDIFTEIRGGNVAQGIQSTFANFC